MRDVMLVHTPMSGDCGGQIVGGKCMACGGTPGHDAGCKSLPASSYIGCTCLFDLYMETVSAARESIAWADCKACQSSVYGVCFDHLPKAPKRTFVKQAKPSPDEDDAMNPTRRMGESRSPANVAGEPSSFQGRSG